MQESAAFYNPAIQVIVFVFLPSKSGNSVAMWRRKINVPNDMRLMLKAEISLALAALRHEEDYIVHVDEYVPFRAILLCNGHIKGRREKSAGINRSNRQHICARRSGVGIPRTVSAIVASRDDYDDTLVD